MDDSTSQLPLPASAYPLVIAIDGPSGSGKSTQSRRLAATLGVGYIDTGAMYRAVTWWCLDRGVSLGDLGAVVTAVQTANVQLATDPADRRVAVDGQDITEAIREPRISEAVSAVATNLDARSLLVAAQQKLIAQLVESGRGCVAEGRDITTVVAPDAHVRLLITADPGARVARRAADLAGAGGVDADLLANTHDQVVNRDARDAAAAQFMTATDGVIVVDTSVREPDDTAAYLLSLVVSSVSADKATPR